MVIWPDRLAATQNNWLKGWSVRKSAPDPYQLGNFICDAPTVRTISSMKRDGSQNFIAQDWQPQTALVRGGLERSPHQETREALYLASGFVYDTA